MNAYLPKIKAPKDLGNTTNFWNETCIDKVTDNS